MPAGVADYGASAWLSAIFGLTEPPAEYWLALCNSEPGAQMDGDILGDLEPDGAGYERVQYGIGSGYWAVESGRITNVQPISFPTPLEDWDYVSHFALLDAATSGDIYAWGEFINSQTVQANQNILIPQGGVVIAIQSYASSITP